jgi:myo-inositol-1(or 4)-monophosphatase
MVRARFYSLKQVSTKDDSSLVTDVDVQSEQIIRDALTVEFPNIGVLGEEMGLTGSGGMRWVVDPIDGTRNFAAGVPHFAISIALVDGDKVLLGITYDPMRDELFHAVKNQGAFLNGEPIKTSLRTSISQAILGFDLGGIDDRSLYAIRMIEHLWPNMQSIKVLGSATLSLAYTAAGRLDVYFHHRLSSWDVAAGLVLVTEAGGQVVDRRTRRLANLGSTGVVASSPDLLEEFLERTKGLPWYSAP